MSAPTVETLLLQAQALLENANAANSSGDAVTFGLQRQARELVGAALDRCDGLAVLAEVLQSTASRCPDSDHALKSRLRTAGTACAQLVAHLCRQGGAK